MADLRVLGPVELRHGGRSLTFSRQQQRFILGVLALDVGRPVATDRLIDLLWGERPPKSARPVLQTRVSELRTAMSAMLRDASPVGAAVPPPPDAGITIESRRSAYVLMASPDLVDAHVFLARARDWRAASSPVAGRDQLRAALALWRGPVLGEFSARRGVLPLQQTLESARLTALEDLFDIELRLGNHAIVADEILRLPPAQQTRERLVELAMIAQYRSGRAAEALRTFDRWRHWLDDELGTTPGDRAREIHRAILRNADPDPMTARIRGTDGAAAVGTKVPRTLPPDVGTFAGRDDELDILSGWLSAGSERVVSITGPPGVGKTALSLRAAHHLAPHFPDGQLFADLRGADDRVAAQPHEILRRFLRAIGVDVAAGANVDDQIDLYRTALADRRVLVVLDNVSDDAQVEPLIPPGPGNRVIINGRSRLYGGLASRTIELRVLDEGAAMGLLRLLVGDRRIDAEQAAARELIALCGQLPLALRIVGARLRARPHWTIDRLAGTLRGGQPRLDQLTHGHLDVRLSIGLSYDDLKPDAKLLLCSIADLGLTHLTGWAAAALLNSTTVDADRLLDELFDAHLADIAGHGVVGVRYQIHDLVRAYALEQSRTAEMTPRLRPARLRLYGVYLHIADLAHKRVGYGSYLGRLDGVRRWTPDNDVTRTLALHAASWFEAERRHILALIDRAHADGDFDVCSLLVRLTSVLFEMRRYFDDWLAVLEVGRSAALGAGDRRVVSVIRIQLCYVHVDHGRYASSRDQLAVAAAEFRRLGDATGVVAAYTAMALVARVEGQASGSLSWLDKAASELSEIDDRDVYGFAMRVRGQAYVELGRLREADEAFTKSIAAYREAQASIGECQALVHQGRLFLERGEIDRAESRFRGVLAMVREIGDVAGVAQCLRFLAAADRARGDVALARRRLSEAIQLVRQSKPTRMEEWIAADLEQLDPPGGAI